MALKRFGKFHRKVFNPKCLLEKVFLRNTTKLKIYLLYCSFWGKDVLQITKICTSFIFSCTKGLCIMMTAWIRHFIPLSSRNIGSGPENVLFVKCSQLGKWFYFFPWEVLVFNSETLSIFGICFSVLNWGLILWYINNIKSFI